MTGAAYQKELAERGQQILEAVAPKATGMWGAHAVLALDGDAERVARMVLTHLGAEPAGPFSRVGAGTFDVFAAMLLACRWGNRLTEKTLDHIREVMVRGIHHRGNTENHWLMYYTGNLLATGFWPEQQTWWNGLPREAMRTEAMRWILGTIDRTARQGHHEYDSPQYHGWHVLPMIALADHADDAHLRHQAEQMATLYIADMAVESFGGAWAGGHSREGYRENTWQFVGTAAALSYFYFGEATFDPMHAQEAMCPAVTAAYRPPALLADLARDRSRARVVKKTKAPRSIYRHVDRPSTPVRKYTFLSPSFALGSTQVGLSGSPAGPIDLVSWDLTWDGPKHEGTVVCNHPFLGAGRFSAFLSELPQTIGRSVPAAKPYLQNPDRLFGASPYERLMQHEGALLALYRIPADDPTPYVNLYLPPGLVWVEREGWILGHAGAFYMGLRPIGAYRLTSIWEDTHIDGWLIRINGLDIGLALEAVEASVAGTFEAFCDAMARPRLDLSGWPADGAVRFETLTGPCLELAYDGAHRVDGVAIDYDSWPLYDAPGVQAALETGQVRLARGDAERVLDFGVDPESEMLPMRVIG